MEMELNREHFHAIIFYNFQSGLTQQQCIDELNSIDKHDGVVNSTEVAVHCNPNFVKVVQNQLLFWKPLLL